MSRIALAGMPAAGHVNPSAPIVRELVGRGVAVTYYSSEEFRDTIERTGAEFRPYPSNTVSARAIAEATTSGGPVRVVATLMPATETLVPFLVEEFRELRPDAVAFDSNALWGYMAAARAELPKISLMTTFMLGTKDFTCLTAREWFSSMVPMVPDIPAVVRAKRRLLKRVGKDIFPPRPALPMRGDVTIFPIPRELQPPNPLLDERCHFVGPTIDPATRPHEADPELIAFLDSPAPVVLVSMGTLHAGTDEFFSTCFTAFADLPARFVLAVGPHARPGTPPPNMLVRESVPQLDILARASAFVTHGGMNSALEGLFYGVPLVVLPQQVEQLIIGLAVASRGAAEVLRHNLSNRAVPSTDLRAAVSRALTDPSMRDAAKALSDVISSSGGASAGAQVIQDFLAAAR
ncbi:glycosyl transferase [Allokutzneria sp. A3M-2-11 16]|uniref:macrolide family glycosyltransferase n=1 Tax=Allokutzneria sp. A3M-2-11 16 TaxID=2962043 RepID=UPI0020B80997|nr:macrolide family glycosyltransferase [Allokutzneria sp. A3M-2-11 16]MCP3803123.1 glycosyl transferase [Allokutzneria sp. A3M-2-11 16]